MSAAAIARMVRELRSVAFPEEQHAIKSAAAWAVAGDFLRCRDFDSADVVVLDGWWALPPLARQLLGRAVVDATRSGRTERASSAAAKPAASKKRIGARGAPSVMRPDANIYGVMAVARSALAWFVRLC